MRLQANKHKSITGVRVLGMGFTFDDADGDDIATRIDEMNRLIKKNPRNSERIFPFIGGEEINNSPTLHPRRYIINFEDWPLKRADLGSRWCDADEDIRKTWFRSGKVPNDYPFPVAADYPDLLEVVERKVKPERDRDNRASRRLNWWKYGEVAPGFFEVMRSLDRVLAACQVSSYIGLVFVPSGWVLPHTVNIFAYNQYGPFAVLQSRIHEVWARFFGSSMKDDLRYTATDCFETFPFPMDFEGSAALESTGRRYYEFRAALMARKAEGLTAMNHRFNAPDEREADIRELRDFHAAMDRAVLDAYGWTDVESRCEFILDYEDDESDEGEQRRRRKPWRYRWPDEIRDEVLARLLELNRQRALGESVAGEGRTSVARAKPSRGKSRKGKAAVEPSRVPGLLSEEKP